MSKAARTRQRVVDAHLEQPDLNDYELAEELGLSVVTVRNYLKGRRIKECTYDPNATRRAAWYKKEGEFYRPEGNPEEMWAKSGVRF